MKKIFLSIITCFAAMDLIAQITVIKPDTIDRSSLMAANGKVFYAHKSSPGAFVYELWATDGTTAGTARVKDINPNTPDELFSSITTSGDEKYQSCVYNDELYFMADDGVHGMEFWKSDGTAAGTNLFFETEPGMIGWDFVDSKVPSFCVSNGTLFFKSGNMTNGYELWKTDGTVAGTVEVSDIYAGSTGSNPSYMTSFNGKVYFTAKDAAHGWELWCSDGTSAGTYMVKDIVPGPNGAFNDGANISFRPLFKVCGNYLYFAADNNGLTPVEKHWWRTDGTASGTIQIETTLIPYEPYPYTDQYVTTADVSGEFYFIAGDPPFVNSSLWRSNGTAAGTTQITLPTTVEPYASMMSLGGYLYFNQRGFVDSSGLASLDGITNVYNLLLPWEETGYFSNINYPKIINDNMFFTLGKWYDYIFNNQNRVAQSNGAVTRVYPGAAPISRFVQLGEDIIFYGHDTIDENPQHTKLYILHPDSIGPAVTVGVEETADNAYIYAYPNPASDKVNISIKNFDMNGTVVSIMDVSGRLVFKQKLRNENTPVRSINIPEDIGNGIYFLRLENAKGAKTATRIVVQRD